MKPFKTHQEQLDILKARGMSFIDEAQALNYLTFHNYYCVINGYDDPFIIEPKTTPKAYKAGTTFEKILSLHQFDQKNRNIVFNEISKIEHRLKSVLAYVFSSRHSEDGYLLHTNFQTVSPASSQATQITDLISIFQNKITDCKDTCVRSNLSKMNYVPLWVLVNVLDFGTVVKFFENMDSAEQDEISSYFSLTTDEMISFIKLLHPFRNCCAHGNRLYRFRSFSAIPVEQYLVALGQRSFSKQDFAALFVVLKYFLNKKEYEYFFDAFSSNYAVLKNNLTIKEMEKVRQYMGFSVHWKILRDL